MKFIYLDTEKMECISDLKQAYRYWVKICHPDCGGSGKDMLLLNQEYEKAFPIIKNKSTVKSDFYQNLDDGYREALSEIINLEDIEIELCGTWLWVSGDTRKHKEIFKEAGFRWSPKKKKWYWHKGGFVRYSKKSMTMDQIRARHGSYTIKDGGRAKEEREKHKIG